MIERVTTSTMVMKIILLTALSLMFAFTAFSQTAKPSSNFAEISFAVAHRRGTIAAATMHRFKLNKSGRLGVSIGPRFSAFKGSRQYFITAPAKITSGSTGPLVLFKENINKNIDSLFVRRAQLY